VWPASEARTSKNVPSHFVVIDHSTLKYRLCTPYWRCVVTVVTVSAVSSSHHLSSLKRGTRRSCVECWNRERVQHNQYIAAFSSKAAWLGELVERETQQSLRKATIRTIVIIMAQHTIPSTSSRRSRSTMEYNTRRENILMKVAEVPVNDRQWRRYGISRRTEMLEKDQREGGTKFDVNRKCSVLRYFKVSRRVRIAS
jgi:hypothetical protein